MISVYYIHNMNLPDAHGITCRKPDGAYTIIINADQPEEVQRDALRHEVGHILYGDFDRPDGVVAEIEIEAHSRRNDIRIDGIIAKMGLIERAEHISASCLV